jgi:serine/threonine protein kinase
MEQTRVSEGFGIPELLNCLKESNLLSAEEMSRVVSAASQPGADLRSLARELVTAGILTLYQLEAVCKYKYTELRIGNYEVLDRLGAGGMGTVFKARHRRMKRIVALKVLSRDLAKDETLLRRFQREVETIACLSHPNIVMAHDADEYESGPFLVMEYVNGHDLASLVQKEGPLDVAAAIHCILQVARGLEYAHGQGIIHRDIKPANLLRDAAGLVKVTDLGLARFNNPEGTGGITQAGRVLGTVDYMPPEQAFDPTSIDHRADIYSLGATLHFLLLGRPPYQGQTMMATLLKHRDAPIPSLTEARQEVPAALDAIFRRMVAKAPTDRYQTMTEVVQALETVQAGSGDTISVPLPGLGRSPAMSAAEPLPSSSQDFEMSPDAAQVPAGQTTDLKQPSTLPGNLRKVVLVEPSRTQSAIIRKYLQAEGVQHIIAAVSGQEALQAVRTEHPDAIVSAMHLSDMTGVQLAQRIHEENKAAEPGFVLISSEGESSEAGTLSTYDKRVVLHKPFTPEQLVEALKLVSNLSQSGKPASGERTERGKLRVLIVDDSATARLHMRRVLEGLGLARFVEAADGAQAVAAAARETFDLIVTDYNMPFMDGRGLVGYLKQNPSTSSVPIVMVTTEQDPAKLEEVRQLGVAAVCDKSFPPEIVGKIIDQLVRVP